MNFRWLILISLIILFLTIGLGRPDIAPLQSFLGKLKSISPAQVLGLQQNRNPSGQKSFGQLLSTPIPTVAPQASDPRIESFLANLDRISDNSRQKLNSLISPTPAPDDNRFTSFQTPTSHIQLPNSNLPHPTSKLQPTPYIPIPTLLAGVNQLVNPQIPPLSALQAGNININPQSAIVIVLLGDSMIETLGNNLTQLMDLLKKDYPDKTFTLINHGQGSTDIENGLTRMTEDSVYNGRLMPAVLSYRPDIFVLESFAYNHWNNTPYDLDRQWMTIAYIIDTIKKESPDTKIILAATIAPDANTYADGKITWKNTAEKYSNAQTVKAYLQNLVNYATSQNYPLADAYHVSLDASGNGQTRFIDQSSRIHPSQEGAFLFSQKIVDAITQNHLIN